MTSKKQYALEYWIDLNQFSKEQLTREIEIKLDKFIQEVTFKIQEEERYLILCITSNKRVIDSCHDKLNFDRNWSFRAKDELGNSLRAEAYPILAEIELNLREFINQALMNSLGFDWWNSFISEKIRQRVDDIEIKAGKAQAKHHHPIEFTFFEDLISIVTTKFQLWSPDQAVTANDFYELLSTCKSIEEIQKEVENRRKVVSFWEDIFSNYFDEKDSWIKIQGSIDKLVIPLRNKVMHHRLVRIHELESLKAFRSELRQVLDLAKTTLSDEEIKEIQESTKIITDKLKIRFNPAFLQFSPEVIKAIKTLPTFDPELLKQGISLRSLFSSEILNDFRRAVPLLTFNSSSLRQAILELEISTNNEEADSEDNTEDEVTISPPSSSDEPPKNND